VLRGLPQHTDSRMLVGSATADDAGVFQIDAERALVQTLDFFTPIVDDPELFGEIAAANSLSDVYAMGGRPLTAMAIAGMPSDVISNDEIQSIFRGGANKAKEASCCLIGGHTIKNPEPIYGLSVTGMVHPDRYLANAHAKDGDVLILTKPLGTGIISTAIKRGICNDELEQKAVDSMRALNFVGADIAEQGLAKACTDITGFGLLGHLWEMCDGSSVTATISAASIPAVSPEVISLIEDGCVPGGTKKNLSNVACHVKFADEVPESIKILLADAQTSGGLLIACPPANKDKVIELIEQSNSLCCEILGTCTASDSPKVIVTA